MLKILYMDKLYINPRESLQTKLCKMDEEATEAIEAYIDYKNGVKTSSEVADEVLDTILTCINMLKKMQDEELIDLNEVTNNHKKKLNDYIKTKKYSLGD